MLRFLGELQTAVPKNKHASGSVGETGEGTSEETERRPEVSNLIQQVERDRQLYKLAAPLGGFDTLRGADPDKYPSVQYTRTQTLRQMANEVKPLVAERDEILEGLKARGLLPGSGEFITLQERARELKEAIKRVSGNDPVEENRQKAIGIGAAATECGIEELEEDLVGMMSDWGGIDIADTLNPFKGKEKSEFESLGLPKELAEIYGPGNLYINTSPPQKVLSVRSEATKRAEDVHKKGALQKLQEEIRETDGEQIEREYRSTNEERLRSEASLHIKGTIVGKMKEKERSDLCEVEGGDEAVQIWKAEEGFSDQQAYEMLLALAGEKRFPKERLTVEKVRSWRSNSEDLNAKLRELMTSEEVEAEAEDLIRKVAGKAIYKLVNGGDVDQLSPSMQEKVSKLYLAQDTRDESEYLGSKEEEIELRVSERVEQQIQRQVELQIKDAALEKYNTELGGDMQATPDYWVHLGKGAVDVQVGVCYSCAGAGVYKMVMNPKFDNMNIESVAYPNVDHHFVLVNRKTGVGSTDPPLRADKVLAVDVWQANQSDDPPCSAWGNFVYDQYEYVCETCGEEEVDPASQPGDCWRCGGELTERIDDDYKLKVFCVLPAGKERRELRVRCQSTD